MSCRAGLTSYPMPWVCLVKPSSMSLARSNHGLVPRLLTRTLERVRTEMTLAVLAYNMKRIIRYPTTSTRSGPDEQAPI